MAKPRLFLIDAFGYLFRAYHARARSGAPPMRTSAGLSTEAVYIFHNMLRKLAAAHHPEYIAAVLESAGPTLREQSFAEYKANRPEMPPDLAEQIPWVQRLLEAMRIPTLQFEGYEADDVIGAISRQAVEEGVDVVIVSSDKDLLQLVSDHVAMLNPAKEDTIYDPAKATEFMGVPPAQVPDLLALKGDAVDNIPGAPGIGEKGARELILRFGSVENAIEHAAEVERRSYRESLLQNKEQILLSKRLATIETNLPVEWSLEDLAAREPDLARLREIYKELEFFSLLREMEPEEPAAADHGSLETTEAVQAYVTSLPAGSPVAVCVLVKQDGDLPFAPMIGLAAAPGVTREISADLIGPLKPWLEDPARAKVTHDLKTLHHDLERLGVEPQGFGDDLMLYAFLLTADPAGCNLEALSTRLLNRKPGSSAGQQAETILRLAGPLRAEVDQRGFRRLYEDIDLPMVGVLARMERTGIRIEPAELRRLAEELEAQLGQLTVAIHGLAGHPFNINSPQQLGKVLFEELNLPAPGRRGKTKALSTAADVLEALAPEHEIVAKVLEYRQLAKLKGTYVDALPELINPATGRLHTTFMQNGAATGRLSSSNPNLQNIPIRTELGRQIRAAFVPRPGWTLLVADYSQIELRLLAHFSRDKVLVEAFRNGEDIHTRTAAEVFGVPPMMVTPELRRNAKAVNFGIVYGQTPFGLAAQLGIDRKEAELYIQSYFERYAGVKKFIEMQIGQVRREGVTRTLFGRERPIPDINSSNPNARAFAERTAINSPLQGSAADLIKLAMIRIDRLLAGRKLEAKMLLQVHDELLFEAPPSEIEELGRMVKAEMENVHRLEVPLVADIGTGANWRDAK